MKLCLSKRLCTFRLGLQLSEAAAEIPPLGLNPLNEFVPETIDIHVGRRFDAAADFKFLRHIGAPFFKMAKGSFLFGILLL